MNEIEEIVLIARLFNTAELDRIMAAAMGLGIKLTHEGSGLIRVHGIFRGTADADAFFDLTEVGY